MSRKTRTAAAVAFIAALRHRGRVSVTTSKPEHLADHTMRQGAGHRAQSTRLTQRAARGIR